jgi:hypothetical protein
MTDPDPLFFTPVPHRRRPRGWTAEAQRAFIAMLAQCGVIAHAARSVGLSPRSAYHLRQKAGAESFAAAWDWALEMGLDESRDRALALARQKRVRPMMRRGQRIGTRTDTDLRLLYAAMRTIGAEQSGQRAAMLHRRRIDLREILGQLLDAGPFGPDEWALLRPALATAIGAADG